MLRIFLAALTMLVASAAGAGFREDSEAIFDSIATTADEVGLEVAPSAGRSTQDERRVVLGEREEYAFRAREDVYLTVVELDAHGICSIVRPTGPSDEGYLATGETLRIAREAVPPIGRRTLFVFATGVPLPLEALGVVTLGEGYGPVDEGDCPRFAEALRDELARLDPAAVANARVDLRLVGRARTRSIGSAPEAGSSEYSVEDVVGYFSSRRTRGISRPRLDVRLHFAFDSAELTDVSRAQLDVFGEALGRPEMHERAFVIAGHTDDMGPEIYNLDLSRRRAESVVRYLAGERGVSKARLRIEAYGETQPLEPGTAPEVRAMNRRVEFLLDPARRIQE